MAVEERDEAAATACNGPPLVREDVLRPQGVPVARVSCDEAELDERVEGPPERVAPHAEASRERDEAAPVLAFELRQDERRPTVVEEADQELD